MNLDKVWDILINKCHIILGTAAQAAIFVYHFKTGHDIGSGIQNTIYAYYGFLGAHAVTYQKWPDTDKSVVGGPSA
jgi:hypothetical protein